MEFLEIIEIKRALKMIIEERQTEVKRSTKCLQPDDILLPVIRGNQIKPIINQVEIEATKQALLQDGLEVEDNNI